MNPETASSSVQTLVVIGTAILSFSSLLTGIVMIFRSLTHRVDAVEKRATEDRAKHAALAKEMRTKTRAKRALLTGLDEHNDDEDTKP